MLALGQMNETGTGMHIDQSQATEYYQRAADLGEPIS
jgi:TPR repeat protein